MKYLSIFSLCISLLSTAQKVDTFYNYPTYSYTKGVNLLCSPQAGKLACLIELDSPFIKRHLMLVQLGGDTIFTGSTTLDSTHKRTYVNFNPLPGCKVMHLVQDTILLITQMILDVGEGTALPTALVTARRDRRAAMDHLYTTGVFSEPTLYSYEMFNEQYNDIGSFLHAKVSRIQGGYSPSDIPYDVMGHPIIFYVNEQAVSWDMVWGYKFKSFAYIKAWESDFVADDYAKVINNIALGFTWEKGSTNGPLKIPKNKSVLIVAAYTYDYPGYRYYHSTKKKKTK